MSILQPEAGIWYAICWVVVVARFISKRLRTGSWREVEIDDYLIILAMCTLTVVFANMHIILHTNSNLIAPGDDISKWSQANFEERIYGSKLTIVLEQMQLATIWLLKACLLLMYSRMTELLRLHLIVKIVAAYVAVSFTVMEVLWFGVWCRPFGQYWAVPPNSIQCSAMLNHLITNAVLNISSDAMILAIPIPLVFKVRLPFKSKLILSVMLFLGCFTICAAAINKYASFRDPFSTNWMVWYLREAFTAAICANLPLTRPVLQRLFNLGEWTQPTSLDGSRPLRSANERRRTTNLTSQYSHSDLAGRSKPLPYLPQSLSEEYLHESTSPLEILYETEVRIEHHPAEHFGSPIRVEVSVATDLPDAEVDTRSIKSRPRSLSTICYHDPLPELDTELRDMGTVV